MEAVTFWLFYTLPVPQRLRLCFLIITACDTHGIKLRNSFLFRFRRRENLKGQNSAKSRLSKFETRHTPQTVKFWKPNAEFWPLSITNTFSTFTGKSSWLLFRGYRMPEELSGRSGSLCNIDNIFTLSLTRNFIFIIELFYSRFKDSYIFFYTFRHL